MDPLRISSTLLLCTLSLVICSCTDIDGGELSKVQETLLQEYRLQVARELSEIKSSRDFLRIFVPEEEIEPTFVAIVNESVQMKNKGRFIGRGTGFHFDLDISDRAMGDWQRHGASVTCGEPTPILLDMFDELNLPRGTGSYLFPGCTWVRRCTGSGCCASERLECAGVPERRVNVTRPFVRVTLTDIDESGHVTSRPQFLNYTLYEDTACECRIRADAAVACEEIQCPRKQEFSVAKCGCKCRRRCPEPFQQDPDTCDCGCAPGNRQCLKIMRGKIQLYQSQCGCVDHGCEPPKCRRHWTFSKPLCRCTERAPPPDRARVLNEVLKGLGSARLGSNVELLSEPASGMVALVTSSNVTTTSFSTTPSTAGGVYVPVSQEKRYNSGQHPDAKNARHDVDVQTGEIGSASTDVNVTLMDDRRTVTQSGSRNAQTHAHADAHAHAQEDIAPSATSEAAQGSTPSSVTTTNDPPYHHRHEGGLGFEDDEDEMTFPGDTGDIGSGSSPEVD